jgi:predicted dehydrogenase
VFAARKRVFIDKPLAASLEDARAIAQLAGQSGVPWFSASSLRFHAAVQSLKNDPRIGRIEGCDAYSPATLEPHHPDLFWYGVHGVEILYALMGSGCQSVTRVSTPQTDVVVGKWADGRIGTFRGMRVGKHAYGAIVYGSGGIGSHEVEGGSMYRALVEEIVKFFRTGVPPVPPDETLEIFAFMQAAQVSKDRGGQVVHLSELSR